MASPSPDEDNRALSSDSALQRSAAALIGLLFGQLAGDKSVVVARTFLHFKYGTSYEQWQVNETTFLVLLLFLGASVAFGVFMERRGWTNYEQIVISVFATVIAAFFVIVNQSLPQPGTDSESLPFKETIYYLGWLVGLWLVPTVLLPNPKPGVTTRIQRSGRLIAVSVMMVGVCLVAGLFLVEISKSIHNLLCKIMQVNEAATLADPMKFWLASPSAVNPICGLFFVVAFSPIWWDGLWQHTKIAQARLWIGSFVTCTIFYAGVFGGVFYTQRGWAKSLVACDLASAWQFFVAFGAFPAVMAVSVLLAFWLTRKKGPNVVGWRVSRYFWWFLPPGLAIGFAMVALFGFAPPVRLAGASWWQIVVLASAHTINGFLLGLMLRISVKLIAWLGFDTAD